MAKWAEKLGEKFIDKEPLVEAWEIDFRDDRQVLRLRKPRPGAAGFRVVYFKWHSDLAMLKRCDVSGFYTGHHQRDHVTKRVISNATIKGRDRWGWDGDSK